MKAITLLGLSLLASLAVPAAVQVALAQQLDSNAIRLPEMSPDLRLGKFNYDTYCASCHGENTVGTDKGPTFLHRVYHPGHHGDAAFYTAPKRGARAHHWNFGDMKPVESVTDGQLETIVRYVRALQRANGIF